MSGIIGLHHAQITIPEGKEQEARDFYCGLLGLAEVRKPAALRIRGGLWLQVGGQQVHLGIEEGVDRSRMRAHVAYAVGDLNEWRTRLQAAGVGLADGEQIPGHVRFEFCDPFGNRVEMIQKLQ